MQIHVTRSSVLSPLPDEQKLGFGVHFSDHIFTAVGTPSGWKSAEVKPFRDLSLSPAASALHYGQALFEGMKAFRQESGQIVLFRPEFNWQRLCRGAERLCMIPPTKEVFLEGLRELLKVDQRWIPSKPGTALYLRPTLIASEPFLGVRPAQEYLFFIILSPVGSYYGEGLPSVKIWVEKEDLRAAPGGLGAVKAAANYAASLRAAVRAKERGYSQVLWLDPDRSHIEEVGTMNVFFKIKGRVVTPALNDSILPGCTRDSVLTLLKDFGVESQERPVTLEEVVAAHKEGSLEEAFGTGTAAVITPIGEFASADFKVQLPPPGPDSISAKLLTHLTGLHRGTVKDTKGWVYPLFQANS